VASLQAHFLPVHQNVTATAGDQKKKSDSKLNLITISEQKTPET